MFFQNTKYFNTHMWEEGRRFFKETYRDVYPKGSNVKLLHNLVNISYKMIPSFHQLTFNMFGQEMTSIKITRKLLNTTLLGI